MLRNFSPIPHVKQCAQILKIAYFHVCQISARKPTKAPSSRPSNGCCAGANGDIAFLHLHGMEAFLYHPD